MFQDLKALLEKSRETGWRSFGKRIKFYAPSFINYDNVYFHSSATAFPSISITGNSCALRCEHCGGKVLSTMIPATTPHDLLEICRRLSKNNCRGCLISGGCLSDGSIPFDRFLDTIGQIKRELGLKIVVHTGIISEAAAKNLKGAGIDAALIDIIGSEDTIREIYNLNIHVANYEASIKALQDSKIAFVPHIIVGLHHGKLKGEFSALEMISRYKPSSLVVIALIPLKGTGLGNCDPPTPEDIARVLSTARITLPTVPITLGCMRPTGRHRVMTDKLAIEAGVNAIAFPEREAIDMAKSMNLKVDFSPLCCSQIYEDLV